MSTHVYGIDSAKDVFHRDEKISQAEMVARAARKVYDEVKASPRPDLPIFWTEYNATYMNDVKVTDSPFMGPWLANNICQCDGLATIMAYWTFSDVFEEQGVVKKPFYGGYGLIAVGGIPKAAFNAFALLHRLGDQRLSPELKDALVTKRPTARWRSPSGITPNPVPAANRASSSCGSRGGALQTSPSSMSSTGPRSPNGASWASPRSRAASSRRRSGPRPGSRRLSGWRSTTERCG